MTTFPFTLFVLAILLLAYRLRVRERRLLRIRQRLLAFTNGDEMAAEDLLYAKFTLDDGTRRRPIDLLDHDDQFELLDTVLGRLEHGVFP